MKYFRLPDLGEGLSEAEIREWHVGPGEQVMVDAPLVSVETAKAIVEIPSPVSAQVAACFGEEGDLVHVGEPLVEFVAEGEDAGTVVGELGNAGSAAVSEDHFIIGAARKASDGHVRTTPAVRALAQRLGVDLEHLRPAQGDLIRASDVERAAQLDCDLGPGERLRGVRRAMAANMSRAHAEVVPVTLFDDADVHAWSGQEDVTIRLAQAVAVACAAEPALNAWYDAAANTRRLMSNVDLGIAVDTGDGLFVPVLRDIGQRSADDLRAGLERLRADVRARSIPPAEMQGATISLSNFGTLGGCYGTPVVIPPCACILGAGRIRSLAVDDGDTVRMHRHLPLSLTFDHRVVTGGEAARFLAAVIASLCG